MFFKPHRKASKVSKASSSRRRRFGFESLEGRQMLTTLVVTTASDAVSHSGVSLRDAIATAAAAPANTSDTITFAAGLNGQTINLIQGSLVLSQDYSNVITIDGANQITVNGGGLSGVFVVALGTQAVLEGLTITGGNSGNQGGGGIANYGRLTVDNCTIENNTSGNSTLEGNGGGIYSSGITLTVSNSAVLGNTALGSSGSGGGISADNSYVTLINSTVAGNSAGAGGGLNLDFGFATVIGSTISGNTVSNSLGGGGGVFDGTAAALTVSNSTISGNSANNALGGGIYNSVAANLTISDSTIAENSAQYGGGIVNGPDGGPGAPGSLTLLSTIVALNTASAADPNIDQVSSALSGSYSLIGDGTGQTVLTNGVNGNLVGSSASPINPLLGGLANNGGPTQTQALLAGSPALNAGGALTTLVSAITSSATSIPVSLAAAITSTAANVVIQIDGEQMLVTNVNLTTKTLTVVRGYNGTTAASHNAGAGVTLPFDQRGFVRAGAPDIGAYQVFVLAPLVVTTASDAVSHTGESLRDAIATANLYAAAGMSDTISFAASLNGQTITLAQGDLELGKGGVGSGVITINGGSQVTISGANVTNALVVDPGVQATLIGLTITAAYGAPNSAYPYLGAIDNSGAMSVNYCYFKANNGNPILNNATGTMTVAGCTFLGNGIAAIENNGVMSVSDSSILYNSGGILNGSQHSGVLTVSNSTIENNNGSGINNGLQSDLTVINSTISANTASQGGGIANIGYATVSNCTISGNSASVEGGGIENAGGGAAFMTLSDSTISGNTAAGNQVNDSGGGGIYNGYGELTVSDCTISGNSALGTIANIAAGGGLYTQSGGVTVSNSTISGNSAADGGGVYQTAVTGGAGQLTLLSTIVAGNTVSSVDPDVQQASGALSGNHDLIGNGTGQTGLIAGASGNQVGTAAKPINPLLGPLANNGGPTQTMALLAGSPAINAAAALTTLSSAITSSATTISVGLAAAIASTSGYAVIQIDSEQMLVTNVNLSSNTLTVVRGYNGTTAANHSPAANVTLPFDQRGFARAGAADIGAYEYGAAAVLVVTTASDAATHSGESLRDATATANADAKVGKSDTITFAANLSGQTIALAQGALVLGAGGTGVITINGANQITISGAGLSGVFVLNSAQSATLTGLTITAGKASDGGAIDNYGALTIINSTISGNQASQYGGGVFNLGSLTVTNSTISTNVAGSFGGGIYNAGSATTLNASSVLGNNASEGGGVFSIAPLSATNSTIASNNAFTYYGGGVYNAAAFTLTSSNVSKNSAVAGGGGIENYNATSTISNSTISGNYTSQNGGGVGNTGALTLAGDAITANNATAGGGISNTGTLSLTNSTISANNAASSSYGGGIYNSATLTMNNVTIAGNSAGVGGGIENYTGGLTIGDSTISGNFASQYGGGIVSTGALTLLSAIVAGNTTSTVDPDIDQAAGALSGKYNLIGNGTGQTGLVNGVSGNQVGTSAKPINPLLGPLANNGGPTPTMALLAGSPAINAGGALTTLAATITSSATSIPVGLASAIASAPGGSVIQVDSEQMLVTSENLATNTLTVVRGYNGTTAAAHSSGASVVLPFDERGFARVGAPDIGAFEYQSVAPSLSLGGAGPVYNPTTATPVAVAPAATLITNDNAFANSKLTVTDTSASAGGSDLLSIQSAGLLTVSGSTLSYNGVVIGSFGGGVANAPLTITFNSSATQAAVLAVAQHVVYSNTVKNPAGASRAISFQLTDGLGAVGTAVTQTVQI